MSAGDDIDADEFREVIRRSAFALADSGILDDWEAVRRTLRACFDVADGEHVLVSPVCRLNLNQRCRAGRVEVVNGHGSRLTGACDGTEHGAYSVQGSASLSAGIVTRRSRSFRECAAYESSCNLKCPHDVVARARQKAQDVSHVHVTIRGEQDGGDLRSAFALTTLGKGHEP
ncbi:hypothetical protein AB4Y38_24535 [Paraburkholderia sp. EG285A]|uniref:hypothetical protein n=1 Tax=Paraburkholderia sp. EG285A TaxID=3237009 RepID=UPI0034D22095